MKTYFALMFVCLTNLFQAQDVSVLEECGIPPEFEVMSDMAYTTTTYNTIAEFEITRKGLLGKLKKTYEYRTVTTVKAIGGYALNTIQSWLHSPSIRYDGVNTLGEYEFHKEERLDTIMIGPYAGYIYYAGWQDIVIRPVQDGFDIEIADYPYMNTGDVKKPRNSWEAGLPAVNPWLFVTRYSSFEGSPNIRPIQTTVRYSASEFESKTGMTTEMIGRSNSRTIHLRHVDQTKYISNILAVIRKNGDQYENHTLINGKMFDDPSVQSLESFFGKKISLTYFKWWILNDCPVPATPDLLHQLGSGGCCYFASFPTKASTAPGGPLVQNQRAYSITLKAGNSFINEGNGVFTYDQRKPCVIRLEPSWSADAKIGSDEADFDVRAGEMIYSLFGK